MKEKINKIRGVRFHNNKWEVAYQRYGKNIFLGGYKTYKEACEVANNFLHNEFINNIKDSGCTINHIKKTEYLNYYISDNGNVFNRIGKELLGFIDRCGYKEVLLSIDNKQKIVLVHRLLLKTFYPIDNMDNLDVNHKDGNKLNNNINNLEWCTRSYNVIHSFRHGLQDNIAGNKIYSIEEKQYIKEHLYDSPYDIAKTLNRNKDTIRHYQYRYRKEKLNAV